MSTSETESGKKKVHAKPVRASFRAVRLKQKGEYAAALTIVDAEMKRLTKLRSELVSKSEAFEAKMMEKFGASIKVDKCGTCPLMAKATEPEPVKIISAVKTYENGVLLPPTEIVLPKA